MKALLDHRCAEDLPVSLCVGSYTVDCGGDGVCQVVCQVGGKNRWGK